MNEMTCCKDATKIVQEKKESECRHGNHGNFSLEPMETETVNLM